MWFEFNRGSLDRLILGGDRRVNRPDSGVGNDHQADGGLHESDQLLMPIPDVSFISSLFITAKIGETKGFDRSEELMSYAGLDSVLGESGDSRSKGGISNTGPSALRWLLVQCTTSAVTRAKDPYLGDFYGRLKDRKNHQIAMVATTRKLLVSIFYMLKREEVDDPLRITPKQGSRTVHGQSLAIARATHVIFAGGWCGDDSSSMGVIKLDLLGGLANSKEYDY